MEFTTLGRTGLKVSRVGIGGGGPSRLGQATGNTEEESISIVKYGLNSGINFIDSAEIYNTESIIGKAIEGLTREDLILSTKKSTWGTLKSNDVTKSLERSLKNLGTDYVDIYHLHGVILQDYDYLYAEIVPSLLEMQDQGKIRFLGITERFNPDPHHSMLQRALQDDIWDVMMVGFNILNQSARERIFLRAIEKDIGILIMFAVRLALSRPKRLKECIDELIKNKQLDPNEIDIADPLGFLLHDPGTESIVDAAYRFCRYEPGTHVILSGTGNIEHLKENIKFLQKPPLPSQDIDRLKKIFRNVDSMSGQ
ncbi:MAG: aldo/keto reductase, partial [Promethearchaeota archaeon]|jgi:aryl-alcohol dehydrogenase-like predicted oxidoreductase